MIADDINERVKAGRETIERSLADAQKRADMEAIRRAAIVAAVATAGIAPGVALIAFRRRQSRSMMERVQSAMRESARDVVAAGPATRLRRAVRIF